MDLTRQHCVSCAGGLPRLEPAALDEGLAQLPGWTLEADATRLHRTFRFADFAGSMRFVDALAALAEAEGHHPDFSVHWDTVEVSLWTHDAGGLTLNDLVLAALIGARPEAEWRPGRPAATRNG
jgi:4a-hydroxytetrahydrobiopterin dehydratase